MHLTSSGAGGGSDVQGEVGMPLAGTAGPRGRESSIRPLKRGFQVLFQQQAHSEKKNTEAELSG